jgi:hypothetical protein
MSGGYDNHAIFTKTAGLRLRCFLSAMQIMKFGRCVLPAGELRDSTF